MDSPNEAAHLIVGAIVTSEDDFAIGLCERHLECLWYSVYREARKIKLELSIEDVRAQAEVLRRSEKVSLNEILRLFSVPLPESPTRDQVDMGERCEVIEGIEKYIENLDTALKMEAGWLAEIEAERIQRSLKRKSRPRRKKSQQEKRRHHERSKQRKLAKKHAKRRK